MDHNVSTTGIFRAVVLPLLTSIGGDLIKHGIDHYDSIRNGDLGDFDVRCTLVNALYDVIWSILPGRFANSIQDTLKDYGKFID